MARRIGQTSLYSKKLMQIKYKLIISIILITLFPSLVMSSLAFNALGKTKSKVPTAIENPEVKKVISKAVAPTLNADHAFDNQDEVSIKLILKKYELILSRESRKERILPIEFNRIICFIELARVIRVRSGGQTLVEEEKMYLTKSLSMINSLFKEKSLSRAQIAQLYFFQGVNYLDLGEKEKSLVAFETAIQIYPLAKFVASLSLYLADIDYDGGRLDKALEGYQRFYSNMTIDERNFANYKMAWINLNKSNIDQAVQLFLKIIQTSSAPSIIQDATSSLSVALSEKYDTGTIINVLEKAEIKEPERLKIYHGVYEIFFKIPTRSRVELWERLLKTEKIENDIIKLICSELEAMELTENLQKETITLQKIQKYLNENQTAITKYNSLLLETLGQALEQVISKSLSKYKSSSKEQNYFILRTGINSYLKLNLFKRQLEVMSLLLELLNERNEDEKLFALGKLILKDIAYEPLRERTKLLILLKYEKKYLDNPKDVQDSFFKLIDSYLTNDKASQWESVAEKYYTYLVKASLYPAAEKIMQTLYSSTKKETHFFQLVTIYFEQKKCSEIFILLEDKKEIDKKTFEYKRECHLMLAQNSKGSWLPSSSYEKNILEFIKLAEGGKKKAAIASYLASFTIENVVNSGNKEDDTSSEIELTRDNELKFQKLIGNDFFRYRFEPEIFPIYQKEILHLVEQGDFAKAQYYLKDCESYKTCMTMNVLFTQLKLNALLDKNNGPSLLVDNPETYRYLALMRPEILFNYLKNESILNSMEPVLILVSSRLSEINLSDEQYKNIYSKVEKLLSKEEKSYFLSRAWVQLNKLKFPVYKDKHRLKDQDIMYFINRVYNTRKSVLADLPSLSLMGERSVLTKAMDIELNMAAIIKASPIPKNLDEKQIGEYTQGLGQLAEEFLVQGAAYQKSILNIEQKMATKNDTEKTISNDYRSPQNANQWNWGNNTKITSRLLSFINEANYIQAMFYLDYLRSISKLETNDYSLKRMGLLLLSANNRGKSQPMITYLKTELDLNKESSTLKEWLDWSKEK